MISSTSTHLLQLQACWHNSIFSLLLSHHPLDDHLGLVHHPLNNTFTLLQSAMWRSCSYCFVDQLLPPLPTYSSSSVFSACSLEWLAKKKLQFKISVCLLCSLKLLNDCQSTTATDTNFVKLTNVLHTQLFVFSLSPGNQVHPVFASSSPTFTSKHCKQSPLASVQAAWIFFTLKPIKVPVEKGRLGKTQKERKHNWKLRGQPSYNGEAVRFVASCKEEKDEHQQQPQSRIHFTLN